MTIDLFKPKSIMFKGLPRSTGLLSTDNSNSSEGVSMIWLLVILSLCWTSIKSTASDITDCSTLE